MVLLSKMTSQNCSSLGSEKETYTQRKHSPVSGEVVFTERSLTPSLSDWALLKSENISADNQHAAQHAYWSAKQKSKIMIQRMQHLCQSALAGLKRALHGIIRKYWWWKTPYTSTSENILFLKYVISQVA